jgi:hypothetical protein
MTFLFLTVSVAGFADHRGPGGYGLARSASVLGLMGSTAGSFIEANHLIIQPAIAAAAPAMMNEPPGGPFAVGWFGAVLLSTVGLIVLAVSARRHRVWPMPAAALVILGTIAGGFISAGGLALGVGLLWAGVSGLRRARSTGQGPPW